VVASNARDRVLRAAGIGISKGILRKDACLMARYRNRSAMIGFQREMPDIAIDARLKPIA
jgi:hypothetical protein